MHAKLDHDIKTKDSKSLNRGTFYTSRPKRRCWSSISGNALNFPRSYFKKAKSRSLLSRQCNRRAGCSYRKNLLIVVVYRAGYLFVYCIKLPRTRFGRARRRRWRQWWISRRGTTRGFYFYDPPLRLSTLLRTLSWLSTAVPSVGTSASIKHARDAGHVKFTVLFLAIHHRAGRETRPLYTSGFLPYNSIPYLYIWRMHSGEIDTFFPL